MASQDIKQQGYLALSMLAIPLLLFLFLILIPELVAWIFRRLGMSSTLEQATTTTTSPLPQALPQWEQCPTPRSPQRPSGVSASLAELAV